MKTLKILSDIISIKYFDIILRNRVVYKEYLTHSKCYYLYKQNEMTYIVANFAGIM